jgi:hypothetical protein
MINGLLHRPFKLSFEKAQQLVRTDLMESNIWLAWVWTAWSLDRLQASATSVSN